MAVRCGKCGAGRGNLMALVEQLENGTKLETVKCICGWSISRIKPVVVARPIHQAREERTVEEKPCTREGCTGTYTYKKEHKLCPRCSRKLNSWESGQRTLPPPFLKTETGWIDHPERERKRA